MNISMLFPAIGAIIITGILAKSVAPSVVQQVKSTKVDTQVIQAEKAIFEAICRYITLEGTNPTSMADLNTKGYFLTSSNNNGFGGTYSFTIDSTKGTVTISTDIADLVARTAFINSYKNTFKPIQGTGNTVNTTFVLPTTVADGNGKFVTGVPIQSTAPNVATNKYWYDTSGAEVVLKMSDGVVWKTVSSGATSGGSGGGGSATSLGNIDTKYDLDDSQTDGAIKYVFDSETNQIIQYVYSNGGWFSLNNSTSSIEAPKSKIYLSESSYLLSGSGVAYSWGLGASGQMGDGAITDNILLNAVSGGIKFKELVAARDSVCGLNNDGDAYCWGEGSSGQLGNGSTSYASEPVPVSGGLKFKKLFFHISSLTYCGITKTDDAYCWGLGTSGRLGNGANSTSSIPVPVSGGLKFKALSVGPNGSCGITLTDDAYCWGKRTGDGTTKVRETPVLTAGALKFKSIEMNSNHTCGITTTGNAYCWGLGTSGLLGTGSNSTQISPTIVSGGLKFSKIYLALTWTCGLTENGNAYCWGSNNYGQLGIGTGVLSVSIPTIVSGGYKFQELYLSSLGNFTCSVATDNNAYCWGYNSSSGKLGNGTVVSSQVPSLVVGGYKFQSLSIGYQDHTCGIDANNKVFCWGNGNNGKLGVGDTIVRASPAMVLNLPQ